MRCKDLIAFITEYEEGSLPKYKKFFFELHLKICPPCREFLESFHTSIKLGKKCCCPESQVPPTVPEDFIQAVLRASQAKPSDVPPDSGPG